MRLLILGGTAFLGRHLVTAARARNHEITLFNRGHHPAPAFANVETIHGDRHSELTKLSGGRWDTVIDTSGYLPRSVKAAAEALSDAVDRYVFVSSISVFADFSRVGLDETADLKTLTSEQVEQANAIDSSGQVSALNYGQLYSGLKALSEQAAEAALPNRVLTIRPGLIVGPDDYTDRFTYWVMRVARGGEVLAPGRPQQCVQFIDVRDLAEWIIKMLERKEVGVYNANGLPGLVTMQALLEECKSVSGSDASLTWVSEDFLLQENVTAWNEMPLWMPEEAAPHMKGFMFVSSEKAMAAGLSFRPLRQTINDTLTWRQTTLAQEPLRAGIDPQREKTVLEKWHDSH
ncbi:MAG TPA: NAD-dependent epimerase/dehydratase family protein [Pyrinomonadaceae bacterium]|nr:NAD-dependent epimerase/dehydratase family protein [Pyrinomonadaceae bacterium]